MDNFTMKDGHMGNFLTNDDPMENVLRQNEDINNVGVQNKRLDKVLTQEALMEDHPNSLFNFCEAEEIDTGTFTLDCSQVGPVQKKILILSSRNL